MKCIFLGYQLRQKGYKVYDLQMKKIMISRDVIFFKMRGIYSRFYVRKVTSRSKPLGRQELMMLVDEYSLTG